MKIKFWRTKRPEPGFWIAQNWPKIGKVTLTSQLTDMASSSVFPCFRVFLVWFSNWSNFHVNIITGSRTMAIFVSKGLTRNPYIGNTFIWVLPNIWRLWRVRETKFGMHECWITLLNTEKCQGYSLYGFWVVKEK